VVKQHTVALALDGTLRMQVTTNAWSPGGHIVIQNQHMSMLQNQMDPRTQMYLSQDPIGDNVTYTLSIKTPNIHELLAGKQWDIYAYLLLCAVDFDQQLRR